MAAAVIIAALAAAPTGAAGRAHLRMTSAHPLTLQGSGFHARERVRAILRRPAGIRRRSAGADAQGRLNLKFGGVAIARCTGFSVVVTGSEGSRAAFLWRAPECPEI